MDDSALMRGLNYPECYARFDKFNVWCGDCGLVARCRRMTPPFGQIDADAEERRRRNVGGVPVEPL